jgi:sugar phosphate permease
MTKPIILVSLIVVGVIILIVIVRGISRAIRSTFSVAGIVAVIVGVITTLLTRTKTSHTQKNEIEKDVARVGEITDREDEEVVEWVKCKYCGSKNRSTETKCSNCGASLPVEQK